MNKNKRERLIDFLCGLGIEVLKEAGLLEDKVEDEPKVKEIERFTRKEFSNALARTSQGTAGWILILLNNRIGKFFLKILILRTFEKEMTEQVKALRKGLREYENTRRNCEDVLTKDLNLIDEAISKEGGIKPTIH